MNILNSVIDKCIKIYFSKLFILKRVIRTADKKQALFVLPFLGSLLLGSGPIYKNVLNITTLIVH